MSKLKMNREDQIVDKALQMFNERGIEYVGLRELAATLNMRVSNITYYFPVKDDLVNRLSMDLGRLNSQIIIDDKELSIVKFFKMLNLVFHNHLKYRCLFLSLVHLMEQNKILAARYKKTQNDRNATIRSNLKTLAAAGYLVIHDENEIEFLISAISLIARFWISEAAVSLRHLKSEEQISHYLSMISRLLLPYLASKGKKQLQKINSGLRDE